jgi:hypothetical protein
MKVFNGITAVCMIYGIWGQVYFLSWFGLYDNPEDITKMRNSWIFLLIPAVYLTVPVLFFVQGFVSTFGLLQNKPDGEGITFVDGLLFIIKKVGRLLPFNLFMLYFGVGQGPTAGHGPYWNYYLEAFRGCNVREGFHNPGDIGGWWTNILFINNLYPAPFEEKCMGWAWFIPCYVQLCVFLPFILAINRLPGKIAGTFYCALLFVVVAVNAFLMQRSPVGIFLTFDGAYHLNY